MKIDAAEEVNDSGRKLPKVARRIARVFINLIVFTDSAFEVIVSLHED